MKHSRLTILTTGGDICDLWGKSEAIRAAVDAWRRWYADRDKSAAANAMLGIAAVTCDLDRNPISFTIPMEQIRSMTVEG